MRRRILLLVVGITVIVVLAFAIPLAVLARDEVVRNAEHSMVDTAQHFALVLRGDPTSAEVSTDLAGYEQSGDRSVWVALPDGTVLGRVPSQVQDHDTGFPNQGGGGGGAGDPGEPTNGPDQPQAQITHVPGGEIAQQVVRGSAGLYRVTVYRSNSALASGATNWWLLLAGASLFLIAVAAVGGEIVTRRIVRPLLVTAQTAHRISAGDVTARAPTDGPREVAEVGTALNRLADRMDADRGDPGCAPAAARGPAAVLRCDRGGRRAGRVLVGAGR
jgi:HAMP domain-containing protein